MAIAFDRVAWIDKFGNTPYRCRFQDKATIVNVSPKQSSVLGVLTLTPGPHDIFVHFRCVAKGLKFGQGTLAGTAGNGYGNSNAAEWCVLPVRATADEDGTVTVVTSDASQQDIEFFFDTIEG